MNIDKIAEAVSKTTPSPWITNEFYECITSHNPSVELCAVLRFGNSPHPKEDAEGVVIIRNNIHTLLECARILKEIRGWAHSDIHGDAKVVRLTGTYLARIDKVLNS